MHWSDRYGPGVHRWQTIKENGRISFCRRIGYVEGLFDLDGIDLEGRADCQSVVTLRTNDEFNHDNIIRTWAYLRLKHAMLMARALPGSDIPGLDSDNNQNMRYFHIIPPNTLDEALASATSTLTFVSDTHPEAATPDFYHHVLNGSRCINPKTSLSHLFVLPGTREQPSNTCLTTFLFVYSHSITDGLSMFAWSAHFASLFSQAAQSRVATFLSSNTFISMHYHLHAAQESLYPPVHPNNPARARWAWAITRVLRHVNRSLGTPFPNPVRHPNGRVAPDPLLPSYHGIIDYTRPPPIPTGTKRIDLPLAQTIRLKSLCREVNVSVGAGIFALLALAAMRSREILNPDELQDDIETQAVQGVTGARQWITGFPIDCRFFLSADEPYDGATLGFSWGHALPFLASDIPFERRFRVLARAANKQLGVYQKGERGEKGGAGLGLKGRDQAVRTLYLATLEREYIKLPAELKARMEEEGWRSPQGELEAWVTGGFTHGISNWGSLPRLLKHLKERREIEEDEDGQSTTPEMVDFEWSVRAREGEFLVGVSEKVAGSIMFCVSYDAGAMDRQRVDVWAEILSKMLEVDEGVSDAPEVKR